MQRFNTKKEPGSSHLACHSSMLQPSFPMQHISRQLRKGSGKGCQDAGQPRTALISLTQCVVIESISSCVPLSSKSAKTTLSTKRNSTSCSINRHFYLLNPKPAWAKQLDTFEHSFFLLLPYKLSLKCCWLHKNWNMSFFWMQLYSKVCLEFKCVFQSSQAVVP